MANIMRLFIKLATTAQKAIIQIIYHFYKARKNGTTAACRAATKFTIYIINSN